MNLGGSGKRKARKYVKCLNLRPTVRFPLGKAKADFATCRETGGLKQTCFTGLLC